MPSSDLDEFPTFWCVHFFVKDGRTKLAVILLVFEVLWQKVFCPSALRSNTCTKSHFENMLSTYMFPPDSVLPQIFDKTKHQKIIRKDTNDSCNSVLNLLVCSKCPIAQSLILEICFLLTCFHQMLSCIKFLMKRKTKKSYIKTWKIPGILS